MGNAFGLYYPHVHFRDDRWLKIAALYLDRLYHFYSDAADSTVPRISWTEVALTGDGFLKPITPSQQVIDRTADRFLAAVAGTDPASYQVSVDSPVSAYDFRNALAAWKISSPLADMLMEASYARDLGRGRLAMDTTLIYAYLLTLSTETSDELGASPLADDTFDQAAVGVATRRLIAGIRGKSVPIEAGEQQAVLVNLAITTVVPRDLHECPVEKIIDFRTRYAGERARFNESVSGLISRAEGLTNVQDLQVLLDHLQAIYDSQVGPALKDLQRALRGLRLDTMTSTVNVRAAVPAAIASSLALLAIRPSAADAAAIGSGGMALGIWTSVQQARRGRDAALNASDVSYLYHLRHELDPAGLAEKARHAIARFAPSDR